MTALNDIASREIIPGFHAKFVHGVQSTMAFWDIKKGSSMPEHFHAHEQITYISEGELEMYIGGEKILFTTGMVHVIPANTPHSAIALKDSRVIDSFSPARDDYR
ncbi:MAG: cupin domain-containing protein [Chitinophagaceae bacterium]